MESVLEFSTRCHEDSMKFTRKALNSQMLWVAFNISLVVFDWNTFINSPSHLTAFSFGAMSITALWSFVWMLMAWGELRDDKNRLKYLNELKEQQLASGERQQYMMAKQQYEQMIENLKEKKNDQGK